MLRDDSATRYAPLEIDFLPVYASRYAALRVAGAKMRD